MLHKWLQQCIPNENLMSGPMTIEKPRSFYKMKIIDKITFSDGWLESKTKVSLRNMVSTCAV
jgi:hypothetical protein